MIAARRRAILIISALCVLAIAALAYSRSRPREQPVLMLLTSLPIAFGESLSLDAPRSPVLEALEGRYRVVPIATSSTRELRQGRLLLTIQPFAQPPEDLVALDRWVRNGGRLLLLADPLLERGDSRPLGDFTRPPPMFLDTGLLAHWGLRLDAPGTPGPASITLGGERLETLSPGALNGGCTIARDRAVARCTIGRGTVVVVADADILSAGEDPSRALQALLAELQAIES